MKKKEAEMELKQERLIMKEEEVNLDRKQEELRVIHSIEGSLPSPM